MKGFFPALTAILVLLTLNIGTIHSQTTKDDRLAREQKCLTTLPSEQCNLVVTYRAPVGTVQCNQKIPESYSDTLRFAPQLKVSPAIEAIPGAVVLMYDPDAPVSDDPAYGFNHLLANVTVDETGAIKIGADFVDYYPPTPPRGQGEHRYQFFFFKHSPSDTLIYSKGRAFSLCQFIETNNLSQPVASSQFRYERT